MTTPMMKPERRRAPRVTVERLAYINLEADNGAIILNVSDGGFCFHSIAPVEQTGRIRFWLSDNKNQIEADGELAWMDETQKRGGLRFTNVPVEVRKQIGNWISQPATPFTAEGKLASPLPSSCPFSAPRSNTSAAHGISEALTMLSQIKVPGVLTGFSGGLMLGLLVSALVGAAFLIHTYPRQFGESLIQLGERLGARSQPQPMSAQPQTISPAPIPVVRPQKELSQPAIQMTSSQPLKLEAKRPVSVTRVSISPIMTTTVRPASATTPASIPPAPSLPGPAVVADFQPVSGIVDTVPEIESANRTSVHANTESLSEKYLEVGKFKDKVWAAKTTDQLAQFGFHAIVIRKGHLWTNSYQVLVGPYVDDAKAEVAHKDLSSRGFRPRSFERGSRSFRLRPGLTLNGTRMPAGDCVISWESYSPDAIVKFEESRSVVATADGKWVKRDVRYDDNAFVYLMHANGSRTLIEIRFAGMRQALVFD
jgi:cell division protein FtsN